MLHLRDFDGHCARKAIICVGLVGVYREEAFEVFCDNTVTSVELLVRHELDGRG